MFKKELFKNKLSSTNLRRLGAIPIDRDNPEFDEIKNTLRLLNERKRLIIFPEGTRNKSGDGNLLEIKVGSGMFAFKTKARVIPVCINKPNRFLRKNHMFVGEPFNLEEFYGEKFTQIIAEKINKKMYESISFVN